MHCPTDSAEQAAQVDVDLDADCCAEASARAASQACVHGGARPATGQLSRVG